MFRHASVLMVLSASASAGDFRFADLGETCDHVVESETAAGSVRIPPSLDVPGMFAFRADVFGKQTEVVYFCIDGELFTGNYRLPLEEADEALRTFQSIYDTLNKEYGAPALDNTPWQFGATAAYPGDIRKNPDGYYVSWHTPRVWINAVLAVVDVPSGPAWRTLMVYGSPPGDQRARVEPAPKSDH